MQKLKIFLWHCAGASVPLLKRCPTDGPKYTGLGATILFTGLLAALSAGYAFNFVFDSPWVAAVLGLVWGLMIFNLDRFIVLSMRKSKRWYKEWLQAIPRIVMAVLIAFVISKPLELRIFQKEIKSELAVLKQEIMKRNSTAVKARFETEFDSLKRQITSLQEVVRAKESQRDALVQVAREEADGTGGSGKVNPGPIYRIKKRDADRMQQELEQLKTVTNQRIVELERRSQLLRTQADAQLAALEDPDVQGLSHQLLALNRLGEKHSSIFLADWFIVLLFICLEIAPIATKLISGRGPYDELLKVRENYYKNYRKEKVAVSDLELDQAIRTAQTAL